MSVTSIRLFGTDREDVDRFVENARMLCENRGIKLYGPISFPTVHRGHVIEHFDLDQSPEHDVGEIPGWFQRMDFSEEERDVICSALRTDPDEYSYYIVFGRSLRIYEDGVAAEIVASELPQNVFLRVFVDVEEIPEPKGNVPYSYDPHADHVTDVDFDAR